MKKLKLLVDSNILIDFLDRREPFYSSAKLLMAVGYVGEFELWMSASQVTDLVYVLTEGGKPALFEDVSKRLRGLRSFVSVCSVGQEEVDAMLQTAWKDAEDALLCEVALRLRADAIVSRNQRDFETDLIPVMDCDELFAWVKSEYGIEYEEQVL